MEEQDWQDFDSIQPTPIATLERDGLEIVNDDFDSEIEELTNFNDDVISTTTTTNRNNTNQHLSSDANLAMRLQDEEYGLNFRNLSRPLHWPFFTTSLPSPFWFLFGNSLSRGLNNSSPSSSLALQLSMMNRDFTDADYETLLQLDEGIDNHKGAPKSKIKSLPIETIKKMDEPQSCCICLSEFTLGTKVRVLPCEHKYHVDCIDKWLTINKTCPIDKTEIC